jgi:hypothetical protein
MNKNNAGFALQGHRKSPEFSWDNKLALSSVVFMMRLFHGG